MQGETFYKQVHVDEEDPMENLDNNQARSNAFGVDLGLAFKPDAIKDLTLALVGKNLNSPAFTVNNAVKTDLLQNYGISEIKLDPAVRAGAAYTIGNWVEFALDMDLTEDKTLSGYKTQNIGGGVNLDLSILELSVGAMSNLSKNTVDSGVVYTAGIATGPDWLHFELAGQVASKTITVDGDDYPNQFAVNFAISSAW
jgi:hypothetical protein